MQYIDTHSHPHFPQYDADRDEMLARMRAEDGATIGGGTSVEHSRNAVAIAEAHPDIWATVGNPPNDTKEPAGEFFSTDSVCGRESAPAHAPCPTEQRLKRCTSGCA